MGCRRSELSPHVVGLHELICVQNEPFRFTHYLFLAQIYRLTAEEAAEIESSAPRPKKAKNDALPATGGVFSVHPEDEYIQKVRL